MNNIKNIDMKNILNKYTLLLLVFSMTLSIALFTSCDTNDDDSSGITGKAPVITEVRMYAESPGDSIVSQALPGDWIVLIGENLKNAISIQVYGVSIDFNAGLFSDKYAAIQIPSVIPFPSIPEDQVNKIIYKTRTGSVVFPFSVVPGPPSISSISNENPVEGDVVTIYGTNLFLTNELVFGGATITEFTETDNGTSISFEIPSGITVGPLSITTASGSVSTLFNVNNYATDVLCNFDNVNTFSWGTGLSNDSVEFPGNHDYFPVLNSPSLAPGDGAWWGGGRSINLNTMQWVPASDLGLSVSQFALKFEINVPEEFDGTSILIVKDYSWTYVARYEPWKVSVTQTTDATTDGEWVTVTIPLTEFRTNKDGKDGTGDSVSSLTELLGSSGSGQMLIYTINQGSEPTSFRGAIDNIRIVRTN